MMDTLYQSPVFAGIMYFLLIIVAAVYVVHKFKQGRPFTIFNIYIYVMLFTYIIITPFQFSNQAWYKLDYVNAEPFYPYLYKSISINFIGTVIFLLAEIYYENRNKASYMGEGLCLKVQKSCIYQAVCMIFVFSALSWLYIVFKYNGGLPLFNGGRTFFYNSGAISFIYQSLGIVISALAMYFGLNWINTNKGLMWFCIGAFLSISTGNRGTFFLSIVYPFLLMLMYKRYKRISLSMILKLAVVFVVLIVFALFIGTYRTGTLSNYSMLSSLLYGNTFSDIRDGSYLFWGYDTFMNNTVIGGKTYLAGILSFIPSSLSEFRTEWSWGRFSTIKMFNGVWSNHFGFRGGNSFEAYVNFRMPGVILVSLLKGYIFANVEKAYNINIHDKLCENKKFSPESILYLFLLYYAYATLNVSQTMANLYVIVVLLICLRLVYTILSSNRNIRYAGKMKV